MSYAPLGIATGRIFETHVKTTNLRQAMEFYGDVLGLEEAYHLPQRQVTFYWIGGAGNAMLGVWEVPEERWHSSHFAWEITEDAIEPAIERLNAAGIQVNDFFGNGSNDPSVHAWMQPPASSSATLTAIASNSSRCCPATVARTSASSRSASGELWLGSSSGRQPFSHSDRQLSGSGSDELTQAFYNVSVVVTEWLTG